MRNAEEDYLMQMLHNLQEEYRKAAEPIVKRLASIRERQLPPLIVTFDQLPQYLQDQIRADHAFRIGQLLRDEDAKDGDKPGANTP
jgi:hypothetical protein